MSAGGSVGWTSGHAVELSSDEVQGIIAAAADIALMIDPDGKITSVILNHADETFGNLDHWCNRPMTDFLVEDSISKFKDAHALFLSGADVRKQIELNHQDEVSWEFPVRYTMHRFGEGNIVLMLGRDLRPIAETQQQLVHAQIALEKGYEARREFDARYRVLLNNTRDAVVFVSVREGRVKDMNEPAASLLGVGREALAGSPFVQAFKDRAAGELIEALLNTSISDGDGSLVLETRTGRRNLRLIPTVFRAAGERVIMCRMETEEDIGLAEDQTTVSMAALFRDGSDAFVFTDNKGVITSANDSFLELVDAAHLADVKGRSLGDFLHRGQIDLSMLIENSKRTGQMRIYSTKLVNDYGSKISSEISATYLSTGAAPIVAFVIRDISRVEAVRQGGGGGNAEDSSRNVMELVGSATLKEIVSETTDVVEKMCIETAVTLTRNNRVAAAEMLGLSRQSLYVKLRKYGLLSKEKD
ncbi:MAG: transcriptional regulator PpsR [Aestuariivita sp.]|uniref:transcriptional regulator PpsR n=1 Tax=Aestuariivita sp. TaxID=1872407 RepID=UPI003BB036CC